MPQSQEPTAASESTAPSSDPLHARIRRIEIISILIVFFFIADLLTPIPLYAFNDSPIVFSILFGICIGQVTLICVWAALAPGSALLRLPWSLSLGVLMWYGLILGNHIGYWRTSHSLTAYSYVDPISRTETLTIGAMVVIAIAVMQTPLWLAGALFRWKLVWVDESAVSARNQFQLRHLLMGTVLLAVLLAMGRQIMPSTGEFGIVSDSEAWLLFSAILVGSTLSVTVPAVAVGLMAVKTPRWLITLGWLFYCGTLSALQLVLLSIMFGPTPGAELAEPLVVIFLINAVQGGSVFVCLYILRRIGLQLVRLPRASHQGETAPSLGSLE